MKLFKTRKQAQPFFPLVVNPFNSYHSNGTLEFTSLPDEFFDKGYAILKAFQKEIINEIDLENFSSDYKKEVMGSLHDKVIFEKYIAVNSLVKEDKKEEFSNEFVLIRLLAYKSYVNKHLKHPEVKAELTLCRKEKDENKYQSATENIIVIKDGEIRLINFNETDGSNYLRIVSALASEYTNIVNIIKRKINALSAKECSYQVPEHFNKMIDIINNFNTEGVTTND